MSECCLIKLLPYILLKTAFTANSKYKIQALFKDFQGPKLHFSSTEIIDKKPYPRREHSKFRLHCDNTEVSCTQVLASKLSTNAKFQNLQDLNSRTFQGFQVLSSTLSVFKHFQGPWSFYSKFKHFQWFLKHAMNPVKKISLYFSLGNGQPRESALCRLYRHCANCIGTVPIVSALCQLYWHTFVPYSNKLNTVIRLRPCSTAAPCWASLNICRDAESMLPPL